MTLPYRSKWLDWQPRNIGKGPEGEPSKPTKPTFEGAGGGFVGFVGSPLAPFQKFSPPVKRRAMPPDDPYSARLRKVLLPICTPDYPAGLIPWLDTAHPGIYADLTEVLPNAIHRLWSEGASLAEFDQVLAEWLRTQQSAVALFRKAHPGKVGTPKTGVLPLASKDDGVSL